MSFRKSFRKTSKNSLSSKKQLEGWVLKPDMQQLTTEDVIREHQLNEGTKNEIEKIK